MRRLVTGFARTRVARRLFVLFVVSAFVPLAAIGLLSFSQVQQLLLQQADQRLASVAKSYGMSLFEHLQLANEVASAAAARGKVLDEDSLARRAFHWLAVVDGEGARVVFGDPSVPEIPVEVRARIVVGRPAVLLQERGDGLHVLVAAPLAPKSPSAVVGELRHDFLWGPSDELPAATTFCVVQEGTLRKLHCPVPIGEGDVSSIAAGPNVTVGAGTWKAGRSTYRARSWAQFLRAGFGTPDWVIIASQPESHLLAVAKEFGQIYIPVVALALLLVTWLTIRQSRNIVQPVEQLAERARGVARNDFRTRLNVRREDEFGELANAFDHMSERLGRQFASLTALGEVDRLILSTQDTAQVIRTVLQRLDDMLPADRVTITLFDHENPALARTYYRPPDNPDSVTMVRQDVPHADRALLEAARGAGHWVDAPPAGMPAPAYVREALALGLGCLFVQPIVWRGAVCGALVLAYRDRTHLDEEERQRAHEIADRVAVAVSSAWRDDQLYVQAHYDALTGLPNRLLFKDRLGREIARAQREDRQFALLFVDLDHFKNVNDSFGHTVGDGVLREAARRITRCVREADTVSRLGGDEFTVLLTGMPHAQEAWLIAETMVASLSEEYVIGEQQCFLSASVGIASYPADGQTVEELLKSADTAMYRAKSSGRAQAVFFEERMNAETVARLTLDRDLRAAIDRGELVLHYQPQVDLRTGAISGAEALVRWNHPTQGLVSPSRFIALAEDSGFIDHIGHWTLQQACEQMRRWRERGMALPRVAVNVSPRQFRRRTLVAFIAQAVAEAGLPASCLEIEITEGLLLDRGEAIEGMLRELGAAGHGIALDDFGTGFSSMSYLKRLPVDTIKIDRAFIEGLDRSADSEAIVAAIIAMSHALGKTVVAEGVETAEQRALLRKLRCDEIQGFYIAPALPPEEFERLFQERAAAPAVA